jgi:hypothetical protein
MKTSFSGERLSRLLLAAILGLAPNAASASETIRFMIDPASSTLTSSFNASANFSGTLIGNYNAAGNPGGTRTLLGAFGLCTSGNQPVPYTGHGSASGSPTTNPTGTFTLTLEPGGPSPHVCLSGLSINLLGAAMPTIPTNSTITYQGFRTCSPTGFFPNVPNLPIPLGDATLNSMTATQTFRNSPGTLTIGPPGVFAFSIPTTVTVAATITLGGGPSDLAPQDLPVTVTGTVNLTGATPASTLSLSVSIMQDQTTPIPGPQDVPFDLPTGLGGTAHLLVDISVDSSSTSVMATASSIAAGTHITPCLADFNVDAAVNSQDFFDFLTVFFANSPDADFNCDGTVNSQDFFDFLTSFFAGC